MTDDINLTTRSGGLPTGSPDSSGSTASGGSTAPTSGDLWQPWPLWEWDGKQWTQTTQFVPYPTGWKTVTHGGVTHKVPDTGAPVDLTGAFDSTSGTAKTRDEVIASQYATIGGQDVYIETEAERQARAEGLYRDSFGYYRLRAGHRDYVTGIDPSSGRRFHYLDQIDPATGKRKIAWDDSDRWDVPTGDHASLLKQREAARSKLARLRDRYKTARADDHTIRNNLLKRISHEEDLVNELSRALGDAPKSAPTFTLTAPDHPKFNGGVKVDLDYAVWRDDEPLSFSNPLREIGLGARIIVRATVTIGERKWKPGMLAKPDMCRVTWTKPENATVTGKDDWKWGDTAPVAGTDEYINQSDGVVLLRDAYAPKIGNTFTGKGSTNSFGAKVELYEIDLDGAPSSYHTEGVDGTITAIIRAAPPPGFDPGIDGGGSDGNGSGSTDASTIEKQLLRFMEAIRWVESSCRYLENSGANCSATGQPAKGAYQFCTWEAWSIQKWGYVRDWKVFSNQDIMAHDRMKRYYMKTLSWARVAWMWAEGESKWDANWSTINHRGHCYTNCVMRLFDGRARYSDCNYCPNPNLMGTCPSAYYGPSGGGGVVEIVPP